MNRPASLVFLALAAAGTLAAQISSVRIGVEPNGPRFYVDGQLYTSPQIFLWPAGSVHTVQFPLSVLGDGTITNYQRTDDDNTRWTFNGWRDNANILRGNDNQVVITASPQLTDLKASVTTSYRVRIEFNSSPSTNAACGGDPEDLTPDSFRYGLVFLDQECVAMTTDFHLPAGTHRLSAYSFPGWAFAGWITNTLLPAGNTTIVVTGPMRIIPLFETAKRVRFRTSPPGLKVLVDRSLVATSPVNLKDQFPENLETACDIDLTRLPQKVAQGFTPLCYGDFDFLAGSVHQIGGETQRDFFGKLWVFQGWSNGLGQHDSYVTDNRTDLTDTLIAQYVTGVQSVVTTSPGGLKINIDGRDNWPSYTFVWGAGSTHRIAAPLTQKDSRGRTWVFKKWSNDGEATQDVIIPADAFGFALQAHYELMPQAVISSIPSGLNFKVDGADCRTPCIVERVLGAEVQVSAPHSLPQTDVSRLELSGWLDGGPETRTIVFDRDTLSFTASYKTAYLLLASSSPAGAVNFKFEPSAADNFYPADTQVLVTATPRPGFKFRRWEGDLAGTFPSGMIFIGGPRAVTAHFDKVPFIAPAGVRNAAGDTPDGTVAAGSIVSIYGENLAPRLEVGRLNPLAQAIADTTVRIGERLLPLLFVSPQQINAQIPSDLGEGEYTLVVRWEGQPEVSGKFTVSRNAPGLFSWSNELQQAVVLAEHEDGTPVTAESPARRGEVIRIYGTGFGPYNRRIIDGFLPSEIDEHRLVDPVDVVAGELQLTPEWTGPSSSYVGAVITKFKIADEMPSASTVELRVRVNGKLSNPVRLPVE